MFNFFTVDGSVSTNMTGRRTKLPCPRPNTEGLSLWNLLCKNIGKDLSQVSMPVALNEPLNMLQVKYERNFLPVSVFLFIQRRV